MICIGASAPWVIGLFRFRFLKHLRADAAQRALVIFRQLVAFVDIAADCAYKFLHADFLLKLRWRVLRFRRVGAQ